jgi:hypothetical protein
VIYIPPVFPPVLGKQKIIMTARVTKLQPSQTVLCHLRMPLYTVALILFIIGVQDAACYQRDYFWREYTGSVPEDAIVGGQDINGKDIYIGQAYVRNEGLIPVRISAGVRQVHAPIRGVKNVDTYTKVSL